MRVLTFVFALMLVMGLSFGGASVVGTQSAIAEHHETAPEGEIPGGEMENEADGNTEGAEVPEAETTEEEGEIPGGDMKDDAE